MPEVEVKAELDLGTPSPELLKWAQENIKEDPDTRCQLLSDFKDLIYSRGECTPHRADDEFLLRFLRSRKFNLESAHRLMVNYCNFREENPHFVEGIGFDHLEKIGKTDVVSVPPYRDQTGKRILLYKLGKWDPNTVSIDEVFSASLLILELAILEEQAQILGGILLVDCAGLTVQQTLYMSHKVAYKIFQLAVTSQPMRLEAVHVVNHSWLFETFFNVFKPFLHERMKERLYFHNDMESLHKYLDPKCLPDIYGGAQPYHDYKEWIDWFRKTDQVVKQLKLQGYSVP